MSNSKNTAKTVADNNDGVADENVVPQQKTEDRVTVIKGGSEDGKDAIIISEIVDEPSILDKAKGVFQRNRKLILGVAAATTAAVLLTIFRGVEIDSDEPSTPDVDDTTTDETAPLDV